MSRSCSSGGVCHRSRKSVQLNRHSGVGGTADAARDAKVLEAQTIEGADRLGRDAIRQVRREPAPLQPCSPACIPSGRDQPDRAARAKFRSYELFARHVAPHFQGQYQPTADAKARARAARPALANDNLKAVQQSTAKYQAELDAKTKG
jgi:hypothetical protein